MRLLVIRSSDMATAQAFAALTANGFNFDQFTNLADADEALASSSYAGILLARRLSDGCGANWLARQRSCGLTTPVIVVTPSASCWPGCARCCAARPRSPSPCWNTATCA